MNKGFLGSILAQKDSVSIRKSTLITIVAVSILLSGFFVLGNVAKAETINVGPDQTYITIQAAINAASPGDTINVATGTYDERLSVTKNDLIIKAVDGEHPIIQPVEESFSSVRKLIDIRGNGVTFSGFEVVGNGKSDLENYDGSYLGIRIDGEGITVQNNIIRDLLTGIQTTSNNVVSNVNNIVENTISGVAVGISLQNDNNIVIGNNIRANSVGFGIASFNTTFENNEINITGENGVEAEISGGADGPVYKGSIQDGINAVNSGDTVKVAAGTYNERVNVNKSLTLRGANAGISAKEMSGERGPESIINPEDLGLDFGILIDGIGTVATVDGFMVENYKRGGILAGALSLENDPAEVHILNNIVTEPIGQQNNNCIQVGDGTTGTVSGNEVSGANLESSDWSGSGILIAGSSNVVVSDNYVHDSEGGIQVAGYAEYRGGKPAESNIIEYNILENNETGISPQADAKNTVIRHNEVLNSTDIGIDSLAYDISWEHSTPSGTEIRNNKIVGSANYGVKSSVSGTDTGLVTAEELDASSNWWGSADKAIIQSKISSNVIFEPYYIDAEMTTLNTEPSTGNTLYVDATYTDGHADGHTYGYDAFSKIQDAIDNANSGDTINVAAGEYIETGQIVINKNLSIVGADKTTTIIKPAQNTGNTSSGNLRGWFLVNLGVTFNLSNVTLDGSGRLVAIAILSFGNGTIENNVIKNIGYNPSTDYYGRGVNLYDTNMTIRSNTLQNIGRIGIFGFGSGVTSAIIEENNYIGKGVGDWLDYGIELGGGAVATISNNTISGNRGVASSDESTSAGILVTTYFAGGTTATITGNTISSSTDGIAVGYDVNDVSLVVAHNNNLSGNTYAINSTHPAVDAANNWWGNASGPKHLTNNLTGTGDAVSDNVSFSPWYTNAEKTSLAGQPTAQGDNQVLNLPAAVNVTTTDNIVVNIPEGTNVSGPDDWDGTINAPTIQTVAQVKTMPSVSGYTTVVDTIIEIGFADKKLTFNKAVRLLIPDKAGKKVGYTRTGEPFHEITTVCSADNQATGEALPAEGDCKIDAANGNDLVVWTKHFTQFITYTLSAIPETTGGGGSSANPPPSASPSPAPTVATSTTPTGQVLGAATLFNFTSNLQVGMSGDAVTELQKRLTSEGVYSGPITGYFGPLTLAGAKAYQQKYGISQTGFIGPLTRAKLNASQVAGMSTANIEAIRAQIASLQAQVVGLLQQLLQILQGQVQ